MVGESKEVRLMEEPLAEDMAVRKLCSGMVEGEAMTGLESRQIMRGAEASAARRCRGGVAGSIESSL